MGNTVEILRQKLLNEHKLKDRYYISFPRNTVQKAKK